MHELTAFVRTTSCSCRHDPIGTPEKGLSRSLKFWARSSVVGWILTFLMLQQCRHFLAQLPMAQSQSVYVSFLNALGCTAWAIGLAYWIGFPVSFVVTLSIPCCCLIMGAALLLVWGTIFDERLR
uniref:Uncharacterized protein n=1 Tax=Globisporangium ultimum (strain ATCC 200006 / CBS 805.95 / DAOM BR144) TaxID=431595 RepID=K3X4D8_GLOUD